MSARACRFKPVGSDRFSEGIVVSVSDGVDAECYIISSTGDLHSRNSVAELIDDYSEGCFNLTLPII